jgi:hypothetical protein
MTAYPRRVAATGKICLMPIPADLSEAFDQAVKELIAWDGGGDEPSVNVGGRPMLISTIAGLVETHKDTMPASVFWRMVGYANRPDRMSGASELSQDSSYATVHATVGPEYQRTVCKVTGRSHRPAQRVSVILRPLGTGK